MPVPVISPTTSILGYRQWMYWEYQPYASETPTSWACSGLPAGMSINATTGKISGTASAPGVYQCPLIATNGTGASAPLVLTIGIEESAILPGSAADITVDLITGLVGNSDSTAQSTSTTAVPVFYAKEKDDLLFVVRFRKGGVYVDVPISSLKLGIKELEPENLVVVGGGATADVDFKKFGSGAGAYFVLPVSFSGEALASVLSNYEADYGTIFNALAELEWVESTNWAGVGPSTLRRSTRTFWGTIERDLIPEA